MHFDQSKYLRCFHLKEINFVILHTRNLPPSQGGKYAGFGYSRDPVPKSQSQEFVDTAVSSLSTVSIVYFKYIRHEIYMKMYSQGWNLLSLGASKIAVTAKERATTLGSLASQKVSEFRLFCCGKFR